MELIDKKHFCRECSGLRKHQMLFEKKISGEEKDYNFYWIKRFQVIECAGCENISFLESYGDNFMMTGNDEDGMEYYEHDDIYPPYLENAEELKRVQQVPENIRRIYKETINAFKATSYLLTAAGLRAIIEALCNHLKIKKGNLAERINLLFSEGHLTKSESKRLHSVRFLGNDALHEIEIPKPEQLEILLNIINHLLSNLFIHDKTIQGKLDIPLDNYDDFVNVIRRAIKTEMLGKEIALEELLGKTRRLISGKDYKTFKINLFDDIESKKIEFLDIINKDKAILKIRSQPKLNFNFDID